MGVFGKIGRKVKSVLRKGPDIKKATAYRKMLKAQLRDPSFTGGKKEAKALINASKQQRKAAQKAVRNKRLAYGAGGTVAVGGAAYGAKKYSDKRKAKKK